MVEWPHIEHSEINTNTMITLNEKITAILYSEFDPIHK